MFEMIVMEEEEMGRKIKMKEKEQKNGGGKEEASTKDFRVKETS